MVKPTLHGSENECASAYVSLHLAPATIASIKTLVRYSHFTTIWLCSKSVMNATLQICQVKLLQKCFDCGCVQWILESVAAKKNVAEKTM